MCHLFLSSLTPYECTRVEGFLTSLLVEVEVSIEAAELQWNWVLFRPSGPKPCHALLEGHVSASVTDYMLFKGLSIPLTLGKQLMGNSKARFKILGWRFSSIRSPFFLHIVPMASCCCPDQFENPQSTLGFYVLWRKQNTWIYGRSVGQI